MSEARLKDRGALSSLPGLEAVVAEELIDAAG